MRSYGGLILLGVFVILGIRIGRESIVGGDFALSL